MKLQILQKCKKSPLGVKSQLLNISCSQRGFTLVELLLYITIVGIIVLSTVGFLSLLMQSRVKNQTISEVEQQGLSVMQIITRTTGNAIAINSPAAGVSAASLSVNTAVSGSNPTIFDLADNIIRVKEGAAAAVSLTNSRVAVSNLTFQNLARSGTAGTIRVQFTLTYVNSSGRNEYDFQKTFFKTATLRPLSATPVPTATPTPTPTSTPTPTPTSTPTPTPTPTVTPTPTPANCVTYCQSLGYSTGTCRKDNKACTDNGETHQSGGDIYCTGGPSVDTCCCRP